MITGLYTGYTSYIGSIFLGEGGGLRRGSRTTGILSHAVSNE